MNPLTRWGVLEVCYIPLIYYATKSQPDFITGREIGGVDGISIKVSKGRDSFHILVNRNTGLE